MNINKIVRQLKKDYPGKKIIKNNSPVTEIICEIDPTFNHPEYSIAIAVIEKSTPHYHKETTEIYEVLKGNNLTVYKNNRKYLLKKGSRTTIKPNVIHWAEGKEIWVKITANPGWRKEDHILI